jgi:hypothetical protein
MKYPVIKKGTYILKTNDEHLYTQTIYISQMGTSVEISFFNSFIEKNVNIKGSWVFDEEQCKYNLNLNNDYNNKKMFFSVDKCYDDYFTLIGGYDKDNNLFQIVK